MKELMSHYMYFFIWPPWNHSWLKREAIPRGNSHKRISHVTVNTFKQALLGYGCSRRLRGKSTCTKVLTRERWREGKKKKKETEKGKSKRTKSLESGNFPVFTPTEVQIQTAYWCIQISRNHTFLACNSDFVPVLQIRFAWYHKSTV